MCTLGSSQWWPKYLDPYHPHRRPKWSSWFLLTPSPHCWGLGGGMNQQIEISQGCVYVCLPNKCKNFLKFKDMGLKESMKKLQCKHPSAFFSSFSALVQPFSKYSLILFYAGSGVQWWANFGLMQPTVNHSNKNGPKKTKNHITEGPGRFHFYVILQPTLLFHCAAKKNKVLTSPVSHY